MSIPPLITSTGFVLNNMMPGEGALGGYTPKGTASSEGAALMLRGLFRAAIATNDPAKVAFAKTIFEAAVKTFYRDIRPADVVPGQIWNHSWIANGGTRFNVRGPIDAYNNLAESGYLYGRDLQSNLTFTNGTGTLTIAPDVIYQVVSADATLVWDNVFSELTAGTRIPVDYYIDSKGNQVFGTQTGGSFGQPAIRAGNHTAGSPGFIKLKTNHTGPLGVNFCTTVNAITIEHGELYEAWPMWRKMGLTEVSTAADAVHWFIDAYKLAKAAEPANTEWQTALDKSVESWIKMCDQESNNTIFFKEGSTGDYNDFPLTYSYAFGKTNIDADTPENKWNTVANGSKYTAARTLDGFVTFNFPAENAVKESGESIRYGFGFENSPLFLTYTSSSNITINASSSVATTISLDMYNKDGESFSASVPLTPTAAVTTVPIASFLRYASTNADSDGLSSGDWTGSGSGSGELVIPPITAAAFPGHRMALIGDSITEYNTGYYPPNPTKANRFAYHAQSMCGYFTYANAILGQRFLFEPGTDPNLGEMPDPDGAGRLQAVAYMGRNWGVASSKVSQWDLETFVPNESYPLLVRKGPMHIALNNLNAFDCVFMMGGTNDLSGNGKVIEIANNIIMAAARLAAAGKWVFLGAIPPRSRGLLGNNDTSGGYTIEKQDIIRQRLIDVNLRVKTIVADLPNIWFVDYYDDLLGPNGIDPAGTLSTATQYVPDVSGNYNPAYGNITAFHDGLHPAPLGAYLMGKKFAEVCIAAGVPARSQAGVEIPINSTFAFTPMDLADQANYSFVGWATVLGTRVANGTVHDGYVHGKMPDNVHFYRGTNQADQSIGYSTDDNVGTYSNFMEYTWSAFMGTGDPATDFTEVLTPFTNDSSWPDGAITTSLVPVSGGNELLINVNLPATTDVTKKNQSFVVNMHVPKGTHGPWDNYGFLPPNTGQVIPNTVYNPGNKIKAMADVGWTFTEGKMHGARFIVNVLSVNATAVDGGNNDTSGAVISGIMNSHNFWPPSELTKMHMPLVLPQCSFKTPSVPITASAVGEDSKYLQVKFEFAFNTHEAPAVGQIVIKNLKVLKE